MKQAGMLSICQDATIPDSEQKQTHLTLGPIHNTLYRSFNQK